MPTAVKPLKKISITFLFFLCAGVSFPQTAPKNKPAPPAAQPQATTAEEDVIPPVAPNALFPAVVAKVNGKSILGRDLEQQVRRELAQIDNPEWKNLREDYRGQLTLSALNSLINDKLIYLKAVESGIKVTDAEVKEKMLEIAKSFKSDAEMNIALAGQQMDRASLEKDLYKSLTLTKYIEENISKKIIISPDEISKYYTGHATEFQHPDVARTSQILIQPAGNTTEQDAFAKQKAEALLARIRKGEDFAKLAKENSMDSSASNGGDIGYYSQQTTTPEFWEAASLPVGEMKIIKTDAGYHIVKVTEKKKEGLSTLEEVKPQLTNFLKKEKESAEMIKVINQLRDSAKIEYLIPAGQPLTP
jgi:peptidyl-prolyl cis-trans isomerase C